MLYIKILPDCSCNSISIRTKLLLRNDILKRLQETLKSYPITVTELRVTNYDWPDSFEKQIEETMAMAQKVKQKQQDLLVEEQEAQKKVKQAEAEKTAMITVAEGEREAAKLKAEAKALEGEGIRKYNESIRQTMDLEVKLRELNIKQTEVEKWNGVYVPNNVYSPIPFDAGGLKPSTINK